MRCEEKPEYGIRVGYKWWITILLTKAPVTAFVDRSRKLIGT